MRKIKDDISDSEIRIIGKKKKRRRMSATWQVFLILVAFLLVVAGILFLMYRNIHAGDNGFFEPTNNIKANLHPLCGWIAESDTVSISGTLIKDTIVNDIPIKIYLPLNAHPALEIGQKCLSDENVILAFQAADIRADNHKIVGAFVLKGKPIAWGLSKKGYCAILRDSIFVGKADNSPLFEEATECDGYFFRQYPLVAEGIAQESELKSQAIRRALCEVENRIAVVETQDNASMHDFSQLLVDLGVDNAIYLIGSDALGMVADVDGNRISHGKSPDKIYYKYLNFIYWTAN
ncbi:MAG: hypothetical protein IJ776_02215 [Paludibacteraceae bacterium]|nr:hypothetical protein [Paludibacteraceae bacterium]